jgi:nucleotide-binding universal stress UspA family protein
MDREQRLFMVKIKKILCPVDFFPASEKAVRYAAGLAANYNARLKLLHVVPAMIPTFYEYSLNTTELIGAMEEAAKRELNKLLGRLKTSAVKVESEVRTGDIATNIKKTIAAFKPDLVAMGTHGRHGFQRWFMGSTTERMLRHSPVPLLTVSAAKNARVFDGRFRRIVVTTDFSEGTADALNYGLSIARENKARITLLHVVNLITPPTSPKYPKTLIDNARKDLSNLVPAHAADWCEVDTRVISGTPYHAILTFLKKEKADLLVMNIHGKSLRDRALLGSTAERVVRAATCPVMLIPPLH